MMIFVYAPLFKKLEICQFENTTCDRYVDSIIENAIVSGVASRHVGHAEHD